MSSGAYTHEDFDEEMHDLILGLNKEQECIAFYRKSAGEVTDSCIKSIYNWFAEAGDKRLVALNTIHSVGAETQAWEAAGISQARAAEMPVESAPVFRTGEGDRPGKAEIISIRQAIQLEKETASIYYIAARRSRDKYLNELWRYYASIEEAHKNLLESYFDGLMNVVIKKK